MPLSNRRNTNWASPKATSMVNTTLPETEGEAEILKEVKEFSNFAKAGMLEMEKVPDTFQESWENAKGLASGVFNIAKTVQEEIARSGASITSSVASFLTGKPNKYMKWQLDKGTVLRKVKDVIFGERPLRSIGQRITEGESWIKEQSDKIIKEEIDLPLVGREIEKSLAGFTKEHSLAVSVLGIGGIIGIDFTGWGGGKRAVAQTIARTRSAKTIGNILKKIGVVDDFIPTMSKRLAKTTDEKAILGVLRRTDKVQKEANAIKQGIKRGIEQATDEASAPLREQLSLFTKKITQAKKIEPEWVFNRWRTGKYTVNQLAGSFKMSPRETREIVEKGMKQTNRRMHYALDMLKKSKLRTKNITSPSKFKKYQDILTDQQLYDQEMDYALKAADKFSGNVKRFTRQMKKNGVRQSIIDELKIGDDFVDDLVKAKREATGEISGKISKSALNYLRKTRNYKPQRGVVKAKGLDYWKREGVWTLKGMQTGRRFFRSLGKGFENLIFNPIRRGERSAAKLEKIMRDELKPLWKMRWFPKQNKELGNYILKSQGLKVEAKTWKELSPRAKKAYLAIKKVTKDLFPDVKKVATQNGRKAKWLKRYAPLRTKDDIKVMDRGGIFSATRKDPFFGSIKKRVKNIPVDTYEKNYTKIMDRWIESAARFVKVGEKTPGVKYLLNSDEFSKIAGKEMTREINDWFGYVVAPPTPTNLGSVLRGLRTGVGTAILGFRYTVPIKQFINLVDLTNAAGVRKIAKAGWKTLTKSELAKYAKRSGTIQERSAGIAIQDLKNAWIKWASKPTVAMDRLTAQISKVAVMEQQLQRVSKAGGKVTPKIFKNVEKTADDIVDAVMGGMSRAETPRYFRTEIGKATFQFYSQLNGKMQWYVTDLLAGKYPEIASMTGGRLKTVSKALTTAFIAGYMEQSINKLSLVDEPKEIVKDSLKAVAGNFPLIGSAIYAFETEQPYVPSPILNNVLQMGENITKGNTGDAIWDFTAFFGMPRQFGKTYEGLVAAKKGRVESKKGQIMFPIEGTAEKVRTVLGGKWKSKKARQFFRVNEDLRNLEDEYDKERDETLIPMVEENADPQEIGKAMQEFNDLMKQKLAKVKDEYNLDFKIDKQKFLFETDDIKRWKTETIPQRKKPALRRGFEKAQPTRRTSNWSSPTGGRDAGNWSSI